MQVLLKSTWIDGVVFVSTTKNWSIQSTYFFGTHSLVKVWKRFNLSTHCHYFYYHVHSVVRIIFTAKILDKKISLKISKSSFTLHWLFGTVFPNCFEVNCLIKQNNPRMKRVSTCVTVRRKRYGDVIFFRFQTKLAESFKGTSIRSS